MTATDLLAQLESRGFFHIRPGLESIQSILNELDNPERRFAAIHIAGTNGKGSVGAMSERVLREAGYHTGLYSSPHLIRVHERIQILGHSISDSAFLNLGLRVLQAEKQCQRTLTYFEFVTAIAFLYFAESHVEIAVIECGLGGLWDATNVLPRPVLGIITSIGLDHTAWLGKTEVQIAREKAGIIKAGMRVISGVRGPGEAVIETQARRVQAPLSNLDRYFRGQSVHQDWSTETHRWTYSEIGSVRTTWTTRLMGFHQADNAAIVHQAISLLRSSGWIIPDRALATGYRQVSWPGRLQTIRLSGRPSILIDGAHNPPAMQKLIATLQSQHFRSKPMAFVFSAFKDKDIRSMARQIQSLPATVYVSSMGGERSPSLQELAHIFQKKNPVACTGGPVAALKRALMETPNHGIVVVAGSLMQAGIILKHLRQRV